MQLRRIVTNFRLLKSGEASKRGFRKNRGRHFGAVRIVFSCLFYLGLGYGLASAQELIWAKQAGGASYEFAERLAADAEGNMYVAGLFEGTSTFGAGEVNETMFTSAGAGDIFVAKYSTSGVLQWARQIGGAGDDVAWAMTADRAGNSFVTGYFTGTTTFGLGEVNQTTLVSAAHHDAFIAKFNSAGTLQWVRQTGIQAGPSFPQISSEGVAVDGAGNSYITGVFNGTAIFGAGQPNQTALSAVNGGSFLAKYDSNGLLQWALQDSCCGFDIAVDSAGNSVVTGFFFGSSTFGTGQPNQTILTASGGPSDRDTFVAKYNTLGLLQWARQAEAQSGYDVATDQAGNIFVAGAIFGDNIVFGAGEVTQTTLNSAGGLDGFVAKYNSGGVFQWVRQAGGVGVDDYYGITTDGRGNVYATGLFEGTATFGAGQINETSLNSAGAREMHIAKYDGDGLLQWARKAGGVDHDYGFGIALDAAGNIYTVGGIEGAATFGAGESNETTISHAGGGDIFIAKYLADMDGDGILDTVDQDPSNPSTAFSDIGIGGSTSGRVVSLTSGVALSVFDIPDAPDDNITDGIKFVVTGPLGGEASIEIDGSAGVYNLTPGEYILGPGSVVLKVLQGSATAEFFIEGATLVVVVEGTVHIEETFSGNALNNLVVSTVEGVASVDGETVPAGAGLTMSTVNIDIKPGSFPNSINQGSGGNVPVAIFSTPTFDATGVNPLTVTLASAPVKLKGKGTPMSSLQDVNGDGLLDLVVHVDTSALQISESDTDAILRGETNAGLKIIGKDSIRVVP